MLFRNNFAIFKSKIPQNLNCCTVFLYHFFFIHISENMKSKISLKTSSNRKNNIIHPSIQILCTWFGGLTCVVMSQFFMLNFFPANVVPSLSLIYGDLYKGERDKKIRTFERTNERLLTVSQLINSRYYIQVQLKKIFAAN